ncbi:MAG: amidohydrolase family protein, partial [Opitutaceae bacterium]|nr:amidohydrolase family protein [Opitutaceae bacterium]
GQAAPARRLDSLPPYAREAAPLPVATVSAAVAKAGVPHGSREGGWLPDLVYTGEKFEAGLAFFADATGRIVRFTREPADLAVARRLEGQAALPGLVNAHSHAWHRALRGRAGVIEPAIAQLNDEDVFDAARMVFLEMLHAGVTCVGEFHFLRARPDGSPWPEAHHLAAEIIRAAHEVGVRIALLNAACDDTAPARSRHAGADAWVRETEALRAGVEKNYPADEAWVGAGVLMLGALPADQLKVVGAYARSQRMRLHAQVGAAAAGRTPLAVLAELGFLDKRFTAVDATALGDDDVKLLGAARALVCACPGASLAAGQGVAPVEKLLAAGAGLALGTDTHARTDLLGEGRLLELHLRGATGRRGALGADAATAVFHAATVAGARSLGATSGALEVGRPADFFTVNLHDPAIAGADPGALLANVVFGFERRAVRDVWVGGRQRLTNGRHFLHGPIVGRFSDGQKKLRA